MVDFQDPFSQYGPLGGPQQSALGSPPIYSQPSPISYQPQEILQAPAGTRTTLGQGLMRGFGGLLQQYAAHRVNQKNREKAMTMLKQAGIPDDQIALIMQANSPDQVINYAFQSKLEQQKEEARIKKEDLKSKTPLSPTAKKFLSELTGRPISGDLTEQEAKVIGPFFGTMLRSETTLKSTGMKSEARMKLQGLIGEQKMNQIEAQGELLRQKLAQTKDLAEQRMLLENRRLQLMQQGLEQKDAEAFIRDEITQRGQDIQAAKGGVTGKPITPPPLIKRTIPSSGAKRPPSPGEKKDFYSYKDPEKRKRAKAYLEAGGVDTSKL